MTLQHSAKFSKIQWCHTKFQRQQKIIFVIIVVIAVIVIIIIINHHQSSSSSSVVIITDCHHCRCHHHHHHNEITKYFGELTMWNCAGHHLQLQPPPHCHHQSPSNTWHLSRCNDTHETHSLHQPQPTCCQCPADHSARSPRLPAPEWSV